MTQEQQCANAITWSLISHRFTTSNLENLWRVEANIKRNSSLWSEIWCYDRRYFPMNFRISVFRCYLRRTVCHLFSRILHCLQRPLCAVYFGISFKRLGHCLNSSTWWFLGSRFCQDRKRHQLAKRGALDINEDLRWRQDLITLYYVQPKRPIKL